LRYYLRGFLGTPPSNKLMSENSSFRQGMHIAFRLGTELTVATIIGGLIGYALDDLLGTKPWGLVICVTFGVTAGCLNVYRIAMSMTIDDNDKNNDLE
jgi:ATP synthase protein I